MANERWEKKKTREVYTGAYSDYLLDINKDGYKEKFWSFVDIRSEEECWIWMGPFSFTGYGQIGVKGVGYCSNRAIPAHRMAVTIVRGDITPGKMILHKCNNRLCVNPNHLREGTHQENIQDMRDSGRMPAGETSGLAKLNNNQVIEIRERRAKGESALKIAKEMNVDHGTIYHVCLGKTWKHIGGPITRVGEIRSGDKLKGIDIVAIRELINNRAEYEELAKIYNEVAKIYNTSRTNISYIARGKTWKKVGGPLQETIKRHTGNAKLTATQVVKIRELYGIGVPSKEIAKKFNIHRGYVTHLFNRRSWQYAEEMVRP